VIGEPKTPGVITDALRLAGNAESLPPRAFRAAARGSIVRGMSIYFAHTIELPQPPARVFAVLDDVSQQP
jgi:hypothetical protein